MTNTNRIGSACWYKTSDVKPGCGLPAGKWRSGILRAWSTDHEEFESGPGLFPVGVVEDNERGTCHSIYVTKICFGTVAPAV